MQHCADVRHAGQLLALHQPDEYPGRTRRDRVTDRASRPLCAVRFSHRYMATARLAVDAIGEVTRSKRVWFGIN